jgi:hypothetical protein
MTSGAKKALWALGLLGLATGAGVTVYYVTKPKPQKPDANLNLPPVPSPGGDSGGSGGGGGGGLRLPNPLDPLGIYQGIYDRLTKKG